MINLLRARRRCRRSMIEDQLRHQAHEARPRFRRQLWPCGHAHGAVRQAVSEQIHLLLLPRLSIVSVSVPWHCHLPRHRSLPDSGRERLWMRQKAGRLMAFDPSTPDREVRRAPKVRRC